MPTDAWFKANPKISGYVPQTVYDCLMKFKDERGVSISQAVTVVLAEYFGVNHQVDQLSLGGVTLAQINSLEQRLTNLIESVDQRFQKLEAVIESIKLLSRLLVDQSKLLTQSSASSQNGETPSEISHSLKNESEVLVPEIIQALEQDEQHEVALPNELLNEPLEEGVSGTTQEEWQNVNTVLLNELQSELPDKEPEKDAGVAGGILPPAISHLDSDLESSDELKVNENELIPGIQPLSTGELSKRLKTDPTTINKYKNGKRKQNLAEWSKNVDPDGVAWEYSEEQKKYIPLSYSELNISLQGELLKTDSGNSS